MDCVGIDVSKATLSCAYRSQVKVFPNTGEGHRGLKDWAGEAGTWCMEATGRYHGELADFGFRLGIRCLVVNPGRAKQYLGFVDSRAKTDKVDALALERLGSKEGEHLRAYRPVAEPVARARDVLVRRRALVEAKVSLTNVATAAGDPAGQIGRTIDQIKKSLVELEKELRMLLKEYPAYEQLMSIPGIGPMSAAILVCTLERGEFATSDSLVAFAGLDPRARDSGKHRGKRTLSHQGDAQLRTILYMAARAGARLPLWKPYYVKQLEKGFSTTEATVILARKLLRVAWSVNRQKSPFIQKNGPTLDIPT